MKKRYLIYALVLAFTVWCYVASHTMPDVPPLHDGDLVFQTTVDTGQTAAVMIATGSALTHMGMIRIDGDKVMVVEAAGEVGETEWEHWVQHGFLNRVAVYRYPDLQPAQAQTILQHAKSLYGRGYDIFFSFNNQSMYCSEVPYVAYQAAGLPIGTVETLAELNIDNPWVKSLIEKRWHLHPECANYDFEQCYAHIMNQQLISPASIARDEKLMEIYSNYGL